METFHKLLILSEQADDYLRLLQEAQPAELQLIAMTNPREAITRGQDCDLAFGEPSLICQVIPHLPGLHWVQATWAGVEPLLDPNLSRDYLLTNARGIFGSLMREFVFGYLLVHERRILQRYNSQQVGRWDETMPGSLRGKQIGLLGVGSIGAELARTAHHFGMRVKGYTRESEACPDVDAYYHPPKKQAFAAELDYLICALPQTVGTRHLVDRAMFNALPAGAVFINVGRGSAVDELALVDALQIGKIALAVLDVFRDEPLPPDHIFWRMPNLLITSHTAAPTFPEDILAVFMDNYRRLLDNEPLMFQVDFKRGY